MLFRRHLWQQLFSKARPRSTVVNGEARTYHSKSYKQAKADLAAQLAVPGSPKHEEPMALYVAMAGKHNQSKDLDNTVGAIMDALQQALTIKNDNGKTISRVFIDLNHSSKKDPEVEIQIHRIAEKSRQNELAEELAKLLMEEECKKLT